MANVGVARNEIADPQIAQRVVTEVTDAAARAAVDAHEVVACTIPDEGRRLEIAVEVPGWRETVAIPSPARPGAVRGAVEKLLRDLGFTRV